MAASCDIGELSQRLTQLMLGFVDDNLHHHKHMKSSDDTVHDVTFDKLADAARVSMDLCILLKAEQVMSSMKGRALSKTYFLQRNYRRI